MSDPIQTAVVTGAGRGFGRAIAAALVGAGINVVGIARGERELSAVREELGEGFTPVAADATDEELAQEMIREHRPGLLVLNAGATPHMAPVHEQTWETFSRNWLTDTRHVFTWTRAALREPLAPGSAASGVVLPLLVGSGVHPEMLVLAVSCGSIAFSHVNDPGFWLFKEYFNLSVIQAIKVRTTYTTVLSILGLGGGLAAEGVLDVLSL
ncbi:SDR family NAD(P)-dependent oxidoreductase [Streptomyces sp. ISL-99]|uniref:SDR family oxidoreductase n=1 Tax=Streptomyces sp. ISL-99 TaxID=2819193 RepID=UPI001BE6FB39|nr:SDR family oxidoreductase [Streptomyces sp. ISL-99]MBT2526360.1 SDR family NAD(P)-dependent oxidoreductase [Streptomyces sp. ISL-99]